MRGRTERAGFDPAIIVAVALFDSSLHTRHAFSGEDHDPSHGGRHHGPFRSYAVA